MLRTLVFIGCAAILTTSCGKKVRVMTPGRVAVKSVKPGYTERGIASWYGQPYHGRRAANGEIYDMEEMTGAHRTMPFGTWVEVENETNARKVKLRITDRGPFVKDRILDVSRRAAEELSMIGPGTARVKLVVIEAPRDGVRETYGVQVGAWSDRKRAEEEVKKLESNAGLARIRKSDGKPVSYRVIAGEGTREQAEELRGKLRKKGYRGIVVRHVP
jgi:rare lipoprotein A